MSTIPNAFVQQFAANIMLLTQQLESRLRPYIHEEPVVGNAVYFDQLQPTVAKYITDRNGDTPNIQAPYVRRVAFMTDAEWGTLIDQADKLKMLLDPTSVNAMDGAASLNRQVDALIIANALGTSNTVTNNGTTFTPVSFPSSQVVAENYVESGSPANSGLTVGKLRRAKAIMDANEVEMEGRVIAYRAQQLQDLLGTTETNSILTNQVRALVDGEIDFFMGFKFVRTELIPTASSVTPAIAFHKRGIGFGVGTDIVANIGPRPDKRFSTQVYLRQSFGTARIDEKRVVRIDCLDSTSTNVQTQ